MMKPVIIFVSRENLQEDSGLLIQLMRLINQDHYDVFFDPTDTFKWQKKPNFLYEGIRYILIKIKVWGWLRARYHFIFNTPSKSIDLRAQKLIRYVSEISTETEITLIARSAGGIVCAYICAHVKIKQVICLGYPFFHPELGEQSYRTKPLFSIQTPFTIFQGKNDEYGGERATWKLAQFSKVMIHFLNTNHDFVMDEITWQEFENSFQKLL
jgi:uncharacterized protein